MHIYIFFTNVKNFFYWLQLFAAPAIAAIAVGIGVPILLFYVYGVVPVSLCRSGGCGLSTSPRGGVRLDFNEYDDNPSSSSGRCYPHITYYILSFL